MSSCHLLSLFLGLVLLSADKATAGDPPIPTAHTQKTIQGWTIKVDDRLLEGEHRELGARALRLLEDRLFEIALILPADKVERLRKVPIWLDATHGSLKSMQYHPSAGWLKGHGFTEALEKCVHIPDAAQFASPRHHHQQPWAVLHELAHAYHDQVLDFEHPEIRAAWERVREGGRFEKVRHIDGHDTKHYALTNQKEFFAEMTEAYFGLNDFFPFHRADLKQSEPEVFALMKSIWGDVPHDRREPKGAAQASAAAP